MLCFALVYHACLYLYSALLLSQNMEKWDIRSMDRVKAEYKVWLCAHLRGVAMSLLRKYDFVPIPVLQC